LVLSRIPGPKQLILEPSLMRPLDRVAKMSVLTKAGVEKVHKFERGVAPPNLPGLTRTYLLPANLITVKLVADQISSCLSCGSPGKVHLILLPRSLTSCAALLEEEGLAGHTQLHSYCWEFIPLDYDLLSLELPSFFRDTFVTGDLSGLYTVARALWGLQSVYGAIPNVFAQGVHVKQVLRLTELVSQHLGPLKLSQQPDITHLALLSRDTDWTSCLLSPLTYEGLLDETFGMSCGSVELPPSVTKAGQGTRLQLSSGDKMLEKIRNKHFASIFSVLGVTAKQLSQAQAAASGMNVTQMKQFVAQDLKAMTAQSRAVALHIGASEEIQRRKGGVLETQLPVEHALVSGGGRAECLAYIEDCLAQLRPLPCPLRLSCLLSLHGGLTHQEGNRLKTQVVQAHGFQHMLTWNNLIKMGLIKLKGAAVGGAGAGLAQVTGAVSNLGGLGKGGSTSQQLAKKLGLSPAQESGASSEPTSAGYVFNGAWVPVATRLVEELLKLPSAEGAALTSLPPSSVLGEACKLLPGDTVLDMKAPSLGPKVVLVMFLGGYTMAEVAAFRWLQTVTGHQFIIAGTCGVNGNTVITDSEKL